MGSSIQNLVAVRSAAGRLRATLPQGNTLPDAMWMRRHVWMRRVLWLHVPSIFVFALLTGNGAGHSTVEAGVIASFALIATLLPVSRRRAASAAVAFGLLTSSAVITHLSGGYIEAHFHFFVIVTLLVLYEDWFAFLLSIAYVLVHHGLGSGLMADAVFNHPAGVENPWKFAAIHAAFISALSVVSIVCWRLNEDGRAEAAHALDVAQVSEERFRSAFANAPIGMALCDATPGGSGRFVRVNRAMCDITGFSEQELLAKTFAELTHPDDLEKTNAAAASLISDTTASYENEKRYVHMDGHSVPTLVTSSLIRDESGVPALFISQVQDITARKTYEEQLAHQALHDALTSLPNRVLFRDRLQQVLTRRQRHGGDVAVLFIDLDRFKLVNDTHGHAAGDEVLAVISERIKAALRETDTVARFGGDEFAVLCENEGLDVGEVSDRICAAIAEPVSVRGRRIVMTASVGIALARDEDDPDSLLRDADAAMYRAKAAGGGCHRLFEPQLRLELLRRVETEHALRNAVMREEFVLHYQPILSPETGLIDSVEALIRWQRPGHGLVFPDQFIDLAEETGLIVDIGAWVLREACTEARRWTSSADASAPKVAVNVSARQLAEDDLVRAVTSALELSGLPGARLSLEVTETAVMENLESAAETMHRLGALGVELALDDFGTGYSSLGQLRRLPFDVLKIDRSFITDVPGDENARGLVLAAVEMARTLGLRAVAEGVENAEQLAFLHDIGCPLVQGYLFSRPLPAAEARPWIAQSADVAPAVAA